MGTHFLLSTPWHGAGWSGWRVSPDKEEKQLPLGGSQGISPYPLNCPSDGQCWAVLGTGPRGTVRFQPRDEGSQAWAVEETTGRRSRPGASMGMVSIPHQTLRSFGLLTRPGEALACLRGLLRKEGGHPCLPRLLRPALLSCSHCPAAAADSLQLLLHPLLLP